ncbi:cytochrome P450 [Mycolicibacterium smegmatis]|uniref:Cytochrome P450 n=1 Tax=Mycolicibacterium smegmatis (strain MKD8) TaxID=1214915 RepID=A0A2U9Q0P0_MYCSE|nr:cytochrome P450 [Mycolicibacterium smegmatis]AWT57613.1 cytochrome P450 [Mycolicibacterium smegmatis MKD8]
MSTDIGFDPYDSERTDALSPRRVRSMKPFLEQTVAGLLQRFADNGGGDFVRDVALPLPLLVLTELVGFTTDTVRQFREITEDMWKHLGAEADDVDFTGARRQIYDLMRAELRRERPADGFIASLRDAEIDGRALTEDEQISVLATLAVAGHETTMNSASTLVHLLVEHPDRQDRLRRNPELASRYVEEMLRHRSPRTELRPPGHLSGHHRRPSVRRGRHRPAVVRRSQPRSGSVRRPGPLRP